MDKLIGASWRTTVAGVLVILAAAYLYAHATTEDAKVLAGTIAAIGVGLIKAKDDQ